jgi:type IV pilus assembly protein PilF
MKFQQCLMVAMSVSTVIAGCSTTDTKSPAASVVQVQAPASQETVRGDARSRANSHANLGFEYYAQRQYGTALEEAKVAIKNDSSYSPAYNLLGLIYKELGDNKSAEESFQRAMQLSPGDPEVANNFGWFLCQTKREQQSLLYFRAALQNTLYPTPVVALANAAECSAQVGEFNGAENYLNRALVYGPNNVRVLMIAANVKYQQKQYAEARYYISEVHKNIEPTAASAWLALRIAHRVGNREEEARYVSMLRKKFADSEESRKLAQGQIE